MGSPVGPPPGDYELGVNCENCEGSQVACFLPEQTPKYVRFDVWEAGGIIETLYLVQQAGKPCQWRVQIPGGKWAVWDVTGPWDQPTWARIWWWANGWTEQSFNYLDPPTCQTRFPNNCVTPDKAGDNGTIEWGPDIDEGHYLAQFP